MRRAFHALAALALSGAFGFGGTAGAAEYSISVDRVPIQLDGRVKQGIGYNGRSPGETLRFKEGEDVVIHVKNNLNVDTSIHWHGFIIPPEMDGVPGISFPGIKPGETFTYRFPIVQSGTYWYHAHSGFQEPDGAYCSIVIEPKEREPFRYDRDYVVILADKHDHDGSRIMRNLKMMPDYYNRKQRTLFDLFADAGEDGAGAALENRTMWGGMRMMPTDIEDVHGYTPLMNGYTPAMNWTGLFNPGERVRLRVINASSMAFFDIRIPGLKMTVVQSDGNNVQPVTVDEFRIGVSETYDVIVRPREDKAYSIIAESMGRVAAARGTLAPRPGMVGEMPPMRKPPLLTMADMRLDPMMAGMDHGSMEGMDHGSMAGMDHSGMTSGGATHTMADGTVMQGAAMDKGAMAGMDHSGMTSGGTTHTMADGTMMQGAAMDHSAMAGMDRGGEGPMEGQGHAAMNHAGQGHGDDATPGAKAADPFYAPGSGLTPKAANGGKFLSYADLKAQKPLFEDREPTREIELRLTGNMERYLWSINDVKYEDSEPIRLRYGERVRFKFVNETMMMHPMHLHGMWSILDAGNGKWNPAKHVINVAPGTVAYMETEVDATGEWAFHCHLQYHMKTGMFRKVIVEGGPGQQRVEFTPMKPTGHGQGGDH